LTRRQWLGVVGGTAAAATLFAAWRRRPVVREDATLVTMYASSSCECCHLWVVHLENNGFRVRSQFVADVGARKTALGVPPGLWSCHTAEVGGRLVEGHVPADIIRQFLAEGADERGIAAPGMPGGSPGMESAPKQPFDVIAFRDDGTTRVYARG
jgi:hypothetical protein